MGFCARHSFDQLEPFIASLRPHDIRRRRLPAGRGRGRGDRRSPARAWRHRRARRAVRPTAHDRHVEPLLQLSGFLTRRGDGYGNVMLVDPVDDHLPGRSVRHAAACRHRLYRRTAVMIGETPDGARRRGARLRRGGRAQHPRLHGVECLNHTRHASRHAALPRRDDAPIGGPEWRRSPGRSIKGVHNYVVHMRPLAGAWLDPTGRTVVALDASHPMTRGDRGPGRADRRQARCRCCRRWDASTKLTAACQDVTALSPATMLSATGPPAGVGAARCGGRLLPASARRGLAELFLGSLRCVNDAVDVHCIGDFDPGELAILRGSAHGPRRARLRAGDRRERRALLHAPGARADRISAAGAAGSGCWCWTACAPCFRAIRS